MFIQVIIWKQNTDRRTDGHMTDIRMDRHTDIQHKTIIPCHYRVAGYKTDGWTPYPATYLPFFKRAYKKWQICLIFGRFKQVLTIKTSSITLNINLKCRDCKCNSKLRVKSECVLFTILQLFARLTIT